MKSSTALVALVGLVLVALAAGQATAAPRFVVGENFTNTYCVPCAGFDPYLDAWSPTRLEDIAIVSYHSWWPGVDDIFYQFNIPENSARINYYGVSAVPTFKMDGTTVTGSSGAAWDTALNNRLAVSSPLTIVPTATYNSGTHGGMLSATITNVSGATVTGNFRVALTESVYYWTPSGNGYPVNAGSLRDMTPDATGSAVNLAPGASTVVNLAYVLPAAPPPSPPLNPDHAQIVCWVQTATREIVQGARLIFPFDSAMLRATGTTQTVAPGGDGDAYLDAGETGRLVVTIRNINGGTATGIAGTLTSSDPYVTVADGSASFGTITAFGSGSNGADPFVINISPSAPSGYTAPCTLTLNYGSLVTTDVFQVSAQIGSPTDPTGPAGVYYAYENTDVGYPETPGSIGSLWVEIDSTLTGLGRRTAHFDDNMEFFALGFPFKYYGVTYDSLTIASNGWIAIGNQYVSLADPTPETLPAASAAPNIIAGMWCDLNPPGSGSGRIWRYYDAANHRYIVEFKNVHHRGLATAETFEFIILDPAYNPTSNGDGEILVLYQDVQDATTVGAGIQNPTKTQGITYSYLGVANPAAIGLADGRVVKYTPDAPIHTGVPGVAGGTSTGLLLAASPNPFTASTDIAFRLPARQSATLEVYGVDGRHVTTLFNGVAEAGVTTARWDGLDSMSRPVAQGLYFARLQTGGVTEIGKVMVLR